MRLPVLLLFATLAFVQPHIETGEIAGMGFRSHVPENWNHGVAERVAARMKQNPDRNLIYAVDADSNAPGLVPAGSR